MCIFVYKERWELCKLLWVILRFLMIFFVLLLIVNFCVIRIMRLMDVGWRLLFLLKIFLVIVFKVFEMFDLMFRFVDLFLRFLIIFFSFVYDCLLFLFRFVIVMFILVFLLYWIIVKWELFFRMLNCLINFLIEFNIIL